MKKLYQYTNKMIIKMIYLYFEKGDFINNDGDKNNLYIHSNAFKNCAYLKQFLKK